MYDKLPIVHPLMIKENSSLKETDYERTYRQP